MAALILGYTGDLSEGERVLAPARTFGSPLADLVQPMPYVQRQKLLDALGEHGIHRYWKSGYVPQLSDDFIDMVVDRARTIPSPLTLLPIFYLHGAYSQIDTESTAFGLRGNQWDFDIISQWTNPAEQALHVQWTRDFWKHVAPYTRGVYVNHLSEDEPERLAAAYGPNYQRLVAVKNAYDPQNVFRMNHNIQPHLGTG